MIDDTRKDFEDQISTVRREMVTMRQDLNCEMEYSRSKNLLFFNWIFTDAQKVFKELESTAIKFINDNILRSPLMTSDWIGNIHFLPGDKNNKMIERSGVTTSYRTLVIQFVHGKHVDLVWKGRTNLATYNQDKGRDKPLLKMIMDKQHTKEYGKQLRYLNSLRLNLINDRSFQKERVKINGNKRDRPTITVDLVTYTAYNIPSAIFGTVGKFGSPPPRSGRDVAAQSQAPEATGVPFGGPAH